MKTPPFLVGAALLFWGWQTELVVFGVLMAVILEASRFIQARWDFSDDDFSRLWTFCTIVFLGAAVVAFTGNNGPSHFTDLLSNPNLRTQTRVTTAGARTAAATLRWLPIILFLFVLAQAYSTRAQIPVATLSLLLRRRWKKAAAEGRPLPALALRSVNVAYPYFAVCLFAASIHPPTETNSYFWGLCILLVWGLWPNRSPRFALALWGGAIVLALTFGFFGQKGLGRLQNYLQNIDSRLLARLMARGTDPSKSITAIGRVGRIKQSHKIVVRVDPIHGDAPEYLREASYRVYKSPHWFAGDSKSDFQGVSGETNGTTWHLRVPSTNFFPASARIACYLPNRSRQSGNPIGLIPLPIDTGKIENLPAFVPPQKNSAGAIFVEGPGVLIFDAFYGSGLASDPPPDTNQDLTVSAGEHAALDQVISELRMPPDADLEDKLRAVSSYFVNNFNYRMWQDSDAIPEDPADRPRGPDGRVKTNSTPISIFLLKTRAGHCEYFATATVLLLRRMGIPARYAVGYSVHEPAGDGFVVRLRDAHSWCVVWNEAAGGWQTLDTTPGVWIQEESERRRLQWLSDAWTWIGFQWSKFRWGQGNLRPYLLAGLVPVLLFLLYQVFFRRRRKRRRDGRGAFNEFRDWPGMDSEFYLIERELAKRGIERGPNEPLSEWLHRALADPSLADAEAPLRALLRLHYQYRFDPRGLSESDRDELRRQAGELIEHLRAAAVHA